MDPIPLSTLLLPETADTADFSGCTAVLASSAQACVRLASQTALPVGLVVDCLPGPDDASGAEPRPTEALIARYKAVLRRDLPEAAEFLYLRGAGTFASLRCAVLAATDIWKHALMAEVSVAQDGVLPFGTDIVAAVGILQRIGVGTVVLCGETAQDVSDALAKCAPYARISLGARVDPAWLAHGIPFPNAEVFLPRRAEDMDALRAVMQTYRAAPLVPRDHDDFLLAPDGTNAHFVDPLVDISDEIEVDGHLSELLLEAEDDAGALKLQFCGEEDLAVFEEQIFMIARPVCLCAMQPELLEAALRIYPGRALYDGTWPLEPQLAKYFSEKYGMICL